MLKCPRYHPNLEVTDGEGVSTVSILLEIIKKIVMSVIGRFVYDWLKDHFKGGD